MINSLHSTGRSTLTARPVAFRQKLILHYGCPLSYSHSKGIPGQTFRHSLKGMDRHYIVPGKKDLKKAMKKYST